MEFLFFEFFKVGFDVFVSGFVVVWVGGFGLVVWCLVIVGVFYGVFV